METPSDEVLIQRIAEGDHEAFAELYDRFRKLSYALAYRITGSTNDAEDALQEAFLGIWSMARSFDIRRGHARSWILAIVHHRAIDTCRRRRGQSPHDPLELDHIVGQTDGVWNEVVKSLERRTVIEALKMIPEEQRQVIELAYFGGYTQSEIAEHNNIPLGTVKSRIRSGMEKLRDLLKKQGGGATRD